MATTALAWSIKPGSAAFASRICISCVLVGNVVADITPPFN